MAKYRRSIIVEARQYDGPKLTVVHDDIGEQTAVAGDWLLGTERGKIVVVQAAKFAASEYVEYDPEAESAQLEAKKAELAELDKAIALAKSALTE